MTGPTLSDLNLAKCTYCNDIVDSDKIFDCEGLDCNERECVNCITETVNGNLCPFCTGEYEPQIPAHPDNRGVVFL